MRSAGNSSIEIHGLEHRKVFTGRLDDPLDPMRAGQRNIVRRVDRMLVAMPIVRL